MSNFWRKEFEFKITYDDIKNYHLLRKKEYKISFGKIKNVLFYIWPHEEYPQCLDSLQVIIHLSRDVYPYTLKKVGIYSDLYSLETNNKYIIPHEFFDLDFPKNPQEIIIYSIYYNFENDLYKFEMKMIDLETQKEILNARIENVKTTIHKIIPFDYPFEKDYLEKWIVAGQYLEQKLPQEIILVIKEHFLTTRYMVSDKFR